MLVTLVAAIAPDRCIGAGNALPWRLPGDLKRFRAMTMGKPVVMGRRTWESLPSRPLAGRTNIVLTRSGLHVPGAMAADGMAEALDIAFLTGAAEACIIGGGEIYALALPLADRMELTLIGVPVPVPGGDAFFPAFREGDWRVKAEECHQGDPAFTYRTLVRA